MFDLRRDIKKTKSLSTIPVVMRRLIQAISDENATFEELSHVIEHDQAIAEKVVAMANSPFFGHSGRINSIEQAVMFLGFDLVKSIAISTTVVHLFSKTEAKNLTEFWAHAFEVAFVSDLLSKKIAVTNGGVCFLAGLLHDIGRLVLYLTYKNHYLDIMFEKELLEKEKERFGASHNSVGRWFLEDALFPEEILYPVQYHHSLEGIDKHKGLALSVLLAEALVKKVRDSIAADGVYNEDTEELLGVIGFSPDDIKDVEEALIEEEENIKLFFHI
ncbi:MAG: HDOD domain-containing protein [Nitrospirae bacterium]|nr:MAG: HDOD domain-containing protein [Nitrospirota bacterium]